MQQIWHDDRNGNVPRLHARTCKYAKTSHGNGRVIRRAVAAISHMLIILGAGIAVRALAAPPADIKPDLALELWFKSLRQPSSQSLCCSISDCRFVDFWSRDGHYEVEIDGWHYAVPGDSVITAIANPTGKAVVCSTFSEFRPPPSQGAGNDRPQDVREILCFVPPRPPS